MFVLDCSVTMPWILKNDPSGYSEKILRHLENESAMVPRLWYLEVVNVLLVRERRKHLDFVESFKFTHWLKELPIFHDEENERETSLRVMQLARDYHLSAYDAAYLELAIRVGTLATLDKALRLAAKKAGVKKI